MNRPDPFGQDIIDHAEAILELSGDRKVDLEGMGAQIDGIHVTIRRVRQGVQVVASTQNNPADVLTVQNQAVLGFSFNGRYGLYLGVKELLQSEAERLHREEAEEDVPSDTPSDPGSPVFVPSPLARLRALISNLL